MPRAAALHDRRPARAPSHAMRVRIAELVRALRRADVAVSVAEAMDAARAAAAVGVDRPTLRDALAAALVKDERERPAFLAAFDAVFPARAGDVAAERRRRARRGGGRGGEGGAGERGGAGTSGGTPASAGSSGAPDSARELTTRRESRERGDADEHRRGMRVPGTPVGHDARDLRDGARVDDPGAKTENGRGANDRVDATAAPGDDARERDATDRRAARDHTASAPSRLGRERSLLRLPFRVMTPRDVDDCAELVRAIAARVTARVRRRLAPRPTGRLDFRRTIRAAVPRAGVPFERHYRGRRPGRPDLVALVDLSASTATATDFFLALRAPAAASFRRVRLFGFVDRLVEIEFVAGQVRPAAPLDLMARSDFGRVLRDLVEDHGTLLGTDTVLVVLGDARNNRRPPRADLLADARRRVRRVLWLNPDPPERWNTGDSVIATYARHVDAVVPCGCLAELERALAAVAKW